MPLLSVLLAGSCGRAPEVPAAGEPKPVSLESRAGCVAATPGEIEPRFEPVEAPSSIAAGEVARVRFRVLNAGPCTWRAGGPDAVRFGYHWSDPEGTGSWDSVVWDDGARTSLPRDLPPGGAAELLLGVRPMPRAAARAKLVIAPLIERVGWLDGKALVLTVDVR